MNKIKRKDFLSIAMLGILGCGSGGSRSDSPPEQIGIITSIRKSVSTSKKNGTLYFTDGEKVAYLDSVTNTVKTLVPAKSGDSFSSVSVAVYEYLIGASKKMQAGSSVTSSIVLYSKDGKIMREILGVLPGTDVAYSDYNLFYSEKVDLFHISSYYESPVIARSGYFDNICTDKFGRDYVSRDDWNTKEGQRMALLHNVFV